MLDDPRALARKRAADKLNKDALLKQRVGIVDDMLAGVEAPYREIFGQPAYPAGRRSLQDEAAQDRQKGLVLQGEADAIQAEADANDPLNPRSIALQDLAKDYGIDASALGAKDIMQTGLIQSGQAMQERKVSQEAMDKRHAEDVDRLRTKDEAGLELQRQKLAEDQRHNQEIEEVQKARLAAQRRKGGAGSIPQGTLDEYTPEAIEKRRATIKTDGYTDNEIDEMKRRGPRFAMQVLGKNLKPDQKTANATASGAGMYTLTPNGTLTLNPSIQKLTSDYLKEREKEQIGDQMVAINHLRQVVKGIPPQALALYFASKNKASVLAKIGSTMGANIAQKIAVFDQSARAVSENFGRKRSGAAIGKAEWDNFYNQLGMGAFSNLALLEAGLSGIEARLKNYDERMFGGRGAAGALAARSIASAPGYQPPWLRKLAQDVGLQHGLYVKYQDNNLKDKNGNPVVSILPVERAKKYESEQKGRILP